MEEGDSDYEYCLEVIDYNLRDDNISLIRTDYEVEVISDKNSANKECKFLDIYETEGNKSNEEKRTESPASDSDGFSCEECLFKTKYRSSLKKHIASVHQSKNKSHRTKGINNRPNNTNRIRVRTKSQINYLKEEISTNTKSLLNDKSNKNIKQQRRAASEQLVQKGKKQTRSTSLEENSDEENSSEENENIAIKTRSSQLNLSRISKFNKGAKNSEQVKEKQTDLVKSYSCELCDFNTVHSYSLKKHLETHNKKQFTNKLYSLKPVLNDKEELLCFSFDNYLYKNTYVCTNCDFFDSDKTRFNLHWFKTHMGVLDQVDCKKMIVTDSRDLNGACDSEKYFDSLELSTNNKTTKSPKQLQYKIDNKKTYDMLCCNLCDYFSGDMTKFVLHLKQHVKERIHACTYCDGKFLKAESLKEHLLLCHETDALYCPVCYHSTNDANDLIDHIALHKSEVPASQAAKPHQMS